MDWKQCCKERLVKQVSPDRDMAPALRASSANKWASANQLPMNAITAASKVSLAYDALRERLEASALESGFRIYNHECYSAFLATQCSDDEHATIFDELRKERNAINYYGKDVSTIEAGELIEQVQLFLEHMNGKNA